MSEAKVTKGALPSGYAFVPKGNVYITSNCRKLTQERKRSVFIVIDAKKQQIGIGVPTEIYLSVQFKERDSRAERAANVHKRDEGIAKGFQKEIVKEFPQIPSISLHKVLKVALEKGKGKVGRTEKLDMRHKVHLAVRAHIRHCETDYDTLLRNGIAREDARQQVEAKIKDVCKVWGGVLQTTRAKPAKTPKSHVQPSTKMKRTTKEIPRQETKNTKAPSPTAADSVDAILRAAQTSSSAVIEGIFARHARRVQRMSMKKPATTMTKPTNQQKPSSNTLNPKVVRTAASFREKRTPKPRVGIQPTPPSPPRVKAKGASPEMSNLDHENRAQILSLVARIDRLEHACAIGTGRKKRHRRRMTKLTTISSLHGQINGILADAAIQMTETSAAARKDLVRRLSRTS